MFILKNLYYANQRCLSHLSPSTIFALSSGHGKCGVAVIRVSGSNTKIALKCLTDFAVPPKPRIAILRSIRHPSTREILDKGLVLWFPGPRSFTGEDCCEFHVHGGIAVVNSVLNALSSIENFKIAEPGEFTRRAFYNGKLDLTEVEGLADLLQAETEAQRKQAFLQTQGALSKLYNRWRSILLKSVAHIEAHIDFEETETLEDHVLDVVNSNIDILSKEIQQHLDDGRKGELLRSGVKTIILGEPNVGKSSLMNVLCQRPAAIVTPIEGTTRDILQVTLNIGGYPLILTDTAGLRSNTEDIIEREGISRAMENYKTADLVILVIDTKNYANWLKVNPNRKMMDYIKYYLLKLNLSDLVNIKSDSVENMVKPCIVVLNKIDLFESRLELSDKVSRLSCKSEEGVTELVEVISEKLKLLCGEPSEEHPSMNQIRHRQHLRNCLKCLTLFLDENSRSEVDTVLMAEYLRKSLRHLGHLVGVTTTEQLLDVIFKDFCIGK